MEKQTLLVKKELNRVKQADGQKLDYQQDLEIQFEKLYNKYCKVKETRDLMGKDSDQLEVNYSEFLKFFDTTVKDYQYKCVNAEFSTQRSDEDLPERAKKEGNKHIHLGVCMFWVFNVFYIVL